MHWPVKAMSKPLVGFNSGLFRSFVVSFTAGSTCHITSDYFENAVNISVFFFDETQIETKVKLLTKQNTVQ